MFDSTKIIAERQFNSAFDLFANVDDSEELAGEYNIYLMSQFHQSHNVYRTCAVQAPVDQHGKLQCQSC